MCAFGHAVLPALHFVKLSAVGGSRSSSSSILVCQACTSVQTTPHFCALPLQLLFQFTPAQCAADAAVGQAVWLSNWGAHFDMSALQQSVQAGVACLCAPHASSQRRLGISVGWGHLFFSAERR
eukprot:TRINITY_DN1203_c3_g4_i1.p2 TRINITY_DN1203_c3_g4~~TRINITY_DN1203_c3_g4_i1.p2  ORF type:complete len:124 (-),score=9.22 TRINITY_DN1203_c3_g4_i1:33-404(-)